ncbi:MAG: hypothetical protein JNM00_06390 [Flavobacteriales bacterium]|nr:hypothetical protein [Flavobacteriales bacterium]
MKQFFQSNQLMRLEMFMLWLSVGCAAANSADQQQVQPNANATVEVSMAPHIDSLSFDDVKINGSIPLKLKEAALMKYFGRPDSVVVEHGWDCGNYLDMADSVKVYYYGQTRFISSGGEAILHRYFPDTLLTFGTNQFSIVGPTMESDIAEIFPGSYAAMLHALKTDEQNETRWLYVGMKQNPVGDDGNSFIFHFEDGKLDYVELWWFIC